MVFVETDKAIFFFFFFFERQESDFKISKPPRAKIFKISGLDGKGVQSHSHAPTQVILKTRVICCLPKTLYGVLSQLLLIHSFSTLLITLILISLVELLYLTLVK